MSSLLPIITEILPMILPSTTEVTHADQLKPMLDNEGRSIRDSAIVGKCDKMCASGEFSPWPLEEACPKLRCNSLYFSRTVLRIPPNSWSPIHHNSEQGRCHIPLSLPLSRALSSPSPSQMLSLGWLVSVSDNAVKTPSSTWCPVPGHSS